MSSLKPTNPRLGQLGVGSVNVLIAAPVVVLIAMSLVLDVRVMYPLATIVIASSSSTANSREPYMARPPGGARASRGEAGWPGRFVLDRQEIWR